MTGPSDEDWDLARLTGDGSDRIARFLRRLPDEETRERMPWLASLRWTYHPRDDSGMPREADLEQMVEFGARFTAAVERAGFGCEAASITGDGLKEWRFYVTGPDAVRSTLRLVLTGLPPCPVQLEVVQDPDWFGLMELHRAND